MYTNDVQKEVAVEQISVAALRKDIGHYLDRVAKGEELSITRRGKVVAKLSPTLKHIDLSDMNALDEEFGVYDDSNAVVKARKEYRY
jgi:prevent-host-death family protein